MKKQSGFTLIELLLVLAIIGIISAIAIPALLGQRARARDKSSISNMEGRVGDLVGQYDKYKEAGYKTTSITTALTDYLTATGAADKNPWNTTGATPAFNTTINDMGTLADQTAAVTKVKSYALSTNKGQAQFGVGYPGDGTPGFIGGAVYVDGTINSSNIVAKVTAIE
jgi:prepilin-type N-terminal cleavage/methylation domain-containing protein